MTADDIVAIDDVHLGRDPDDGIALKAVTASLDPVELTSRQARELAVLLLRMAVGEDP